MLDVCTNAAPVSKFVLAEVGNVSVASLKSNVPVNTVSLDIVCVPDVLVLTTELLTFNLPESNTNPEVPVAVLLRRSTLNVLLADRLPPPVKPVPATIFLASISVLNVLSVETSPSFDAIAVLKLDNTPAIVVAP